MPRKRLLKNTVLLFLFFESIALVIFLTHLFTTRTPDTYLLIIASIFNLIPAFVAAKLLIKYKEVTVYNQITPVLEFIIDRNRKLHHINKTALDFFEFGKLTAAELNSKINSWIDAEDPGLMSDDYEKFESSRNGRKILFTKIKDNKNRNLMFFGEDITEMKTIEDEMRKMIAAVEQSAGTIVITNLEGNITYANKAFETITGYSRNEVLGKNPSILKSGYHDDKFYAELWDIITKGNIWRGNFLNKKKNGELYWEKATITPVKNNENQIHSFIAHKEDITDRLKLEQDLRAAKIEAEKANKLKSDFLANMSHELRTPLNSILGFTEVLLIKNPESENSDMLKKIQKSGENLLFTVNEILDLSKIEADKTSIDPAPFELKHLLDELNDMFKVLADDKSLSLKFNTEPGMPEILNGGGPQIKHILTNLIGNAVKFTEQGFVRVNAGYKNGVLGISVVDSGIGIPVEHLQSIFESFNQVDAHKNRKHEGTGLGLTISKKLAEMMGGTITVQSIEGKGSVFTLRIPQVAAASLNSELPSFSILGRESEGLETMNSTDFALEYNTESLTKKELRALSEIIEFLNQVSAEDDIDILLEAADNIAGIAPKPVFRAMANDLRRVWEHIDFPALEDFISKLNSIVRKTDH